MSQLCETEAREQFHLRALRLRLNLGLPTLARSLSEISRSVFERSSDESRRDEFFGLMDRLEVMEALETKWGPGACLNLEHSLVKQLLKGKRSNGSPFLPSPLMENARRLQRFNST